MVNKKVITCAGYGGTGSSAITDILKEFDNVKCTGDFEFALLHEVDGVSDLQHYLVDDFHRLKATEAIYRFKKLINNLKSSYDPFFNYKFNILSKEYIDKITDVKWNGFWHQHLLRHSKIVRKFKYYYPAKIQRKINKYLQFNKDYEFVPYYKRSEMRIGFNSEEFFINTREYINNLLKELDKNNEYKYLALDQLTPPYNLERYSAYFYDIKIIVIDRDPRDLYLLNKLYWKEGWIPSDNVNDFIKWFKGIRNFKVNNSHNVLKLNFEDLIFDYENTLNKILKFLELDSNNHINKNKFFNPEKSIKNCRLWEKVSDNQEEIRLIEKELLEFCYVIDGENNV